MAKKVKQIKGREVHPIEVGKRAYFYREETDDFLETSVVVKVTQIDIFNYIVETKNTIYEWRRFGLLTPEIIDRLTTILNNRKSF